MRNVFPCWIPLFHKTMLCAEISQSQKHQCFSRDNYGFAMSGFHTIRKCHWNHMDSCIPMSFRKIQRFYVICRKHMISNGNPSQGFPGGIYGNSKNSSDGTPREFQGPLQENSKGTPRKSPREFQGAFQWNSIGIPMELQGSLQGHSNGMSGGF